VPCSASSNATFGGAEDRLKDRIILHRFVELCGGTSTALIIERGVGVEIIGQGAVTIVDGRNMLSNYESIDVRERLELLGVRLHVLPSGHSYRVGLKAQHSRCLPDSLMEAIGLLVEPGPIRE
jgi:cyanophycinase